MGCGSRWLTAPFDWIAESGVEFDWILRFSRFPGGARTGAIDFSVIGFDLIELGRPHP